MTRTLRTAAAIALSLALAISACARTAPRSSPTETPSSPATTGTPSETPSTAEPARMPDRFAFINYAKDFRVELRSSADGAVERVLVEPADGVGSRGELSVDPLGGIAYYQEFTAEDIGGCLDRVKAVTLATGEVRTVAKGYGPVVSPDGRWLAYVGLGDGDQCARDRPLVVLDLETGDERRWAARPWDQAYGEPQVATGFPDAWAPDSKRLLYQVTIGDPGFAFFTIDRTKGDDVLDGDRIPIENDLSALFETELVDAGTLIAVYSDIHTFDRPDTIWRIDVSSGSSRKVTALRAELSSLDIAGGFWIMSGSDETGLKADGSNYADLPTFIWTWDGTGEPEKIAGVRGDVAWID